jgi:hypothetical protein
MIILDYIANGSACAAAQPSLSATIKLQLRNQYNQR